MLPKIEPETIQTHPDAQRADAAYDEFERRFAELTERAHQRALAAARKAGFSSVEEYREATDKETARLAACARKRIEKETGKSWEQFWATHPQRERTPPKSFPRCNCDCMYFFLSAGHVSFPANIASYRPSYPNVLCQFPG